MPGTAMKQGAGICLLGRGYLQKQDYFKKTHEMNVSLTAIVVPGCCTGCTHPPLCRGAHRKETARPSWCRPFRASCAGVREDCHRTVLYCCPKGATVAAAARTAAQFSEAAGLVSRLVCVLVGKEEVLIAEFVLALVVGFMLASAVARGPRNAAATAGSNNC